MRFILAAAIAMFLALGAMSNATAGSYQGGGVYTGTPSAAVTGLFARFPNGGDGLVAAIRDLIIGNPALADDVAFVGAQGNLAQQQAAGNGLAQAVVVLINRGNNGGAARIVNAAQQSGAPPIQLAVSTSVATTVGFNSYQSTNSNSGTTCTTTGGTGTVSPANPSTTTCQ